MIFRAIEPTDDQFLHKMDSSPSSFANSNPQLPKPQTLAETTSNREDMTKGLIAVMICLPPAPKSTYTQKDTPSTADNRDEAQKPTPIGYIILSAAPKFRHHRNASLGIDILEEYQGKGYGSEAIKWILEFAFQSIGLHKVELGCFEYNPGALRLYERIGFVQEGFKRDQWFFQGKFWGDHCLGMLESDWRKLREEGKL